MQTAAADGLYDRCIMQSGFAGNMVFPKPGDNGYTIVSKTLKALGLGEGDAEKLEDMPYDRLLSAYMSAYGEESAKYNADGVYRYVGKTVLPNDYFAGYPFDVGMREQSKRIPVIIGSALAEQQSLRLNVAEHKNMKTETERLEALRSIYGEQTEKVAALWKSAYPDKNLLDMINYETVFRAKVLEFCDLKAAWNAPAYLYLFALESPFNGGLPAHHGAEVPYVFHNTDKTPATNNPGVSEVVEEQICRAWVGFARSGDPNHEKLPFWPKYTSESPATMIFDNPTRVGVGFDAELVALNNALIPWRRFPI